MKIIKLLPLLILFISCKKTEIPDAVINAENSDGVQSGLPEEVNAINGYLYASYNSSQKNNRMLTTYASFGDPGKNLMAGFNHHYDILIDIGPERGNVSVGNSITLSGYSNFISINGNGSSSNAFYYGYKRNIGSLNAFAGWKYDGNKSFKGQSITVPRGFPKLNDSLIKPFDTITIKKGYSVKTENRFSNHDSITVYLTSTFDDSIMLIKTFAAGVPVVIGSEELARFADVQYVYINFKSFNYSNQIIDGKKLVYELSGVTDEKTLRIVP